MPKRTDATHHRSVILAIKDKGGVGNSHLALATATILRTADDRREITVRTAGATAKSAPHDIASRSPIEPKQTATDKGA